MIPNDINTTELRELYEARKDSPDAVTTYNSRLTRELAEARKRNEDAIEAEQARWQKRLDAQIAEVYPDRDGGGCESGDPLDVTDSELRQAFNYLAEVADELRSQLAARDAVIEKAKAIRHLIVGSRGRFCSTECLGTCPECRAIAEFESALAAGGKR